MMKQLLYILFLVYCLLDLSQIPIYSQISNKPQLVIAPQGHSAVVKKILFTKDGQSLISVGDDKVIYFWEVATGRLERSLRPFIGEGTTGALYAAALSPTEQFLAVGGMGIKEGEKSLVIIDLHTDQQVARLTGHKNIITDLAFSQEGDYLASASASAEDKIYLWDTETWQELNVLEGHREKVNSIAFSPDGNRLVSAAADGQLFLWDTATGRIVTKLKKHKQAVSTVAWSLNGAYIVSGGDDGQLLLWDHKGQLIKQLDERPNKIKTLSFSPNSQQIVVSEQETNHQLVYDIASGNILQTFNKHDRSVPTNAFASTGMIASAGGKDADIYIWDIANLNVKTHIVGHGKSVWTVGLKKELEVGIGQTETDGNLGNDPIQKSFDFATLKFQLSVNDADFKRTQVTNGKQKLKKINNYQLSIGKKSIDNDKKTDGSIKCYTFTPNGNVLVGSSFSLKLYRANGEPIRDFIGHGGPVWSVSVSKDGRYLVSGSYDQTVKLWNLESGECLASLFVSERGEWICWNPKGYYDASAGGEKYMGWHLNQGKDSLALYYPSHTYRKAFLQAELLKRIIALGSYEKGIVDYNETATAKRQVDTNPSIAEKKPPEINWKQPTNFNTESADRKFPISFFVNSTSEVEEIAVRINGSFMGNARGFTKKEKQDKNSYMDTVTLNRGENIITIESKNKHGWGISKERHITYKPSGYTENTLKGNLYLLSIGVSDYENTTYNLDYADKDAIAISNCFETQEGLLYKQVHEKQLLNREATRENIIDAFEWLEESVKDEDVVIIFIASHGFSYRDGFYILPYEGKHDNLRSSAVAWGTFADILKGMSGKVLLLIDACHSGRLGQNMTVLSTMTNITRKAEEYGVAIMAASTDEQESIESEAWGHGAFTKAILDGLNEKEADFFYKDKTIYLKEIDLFVGERVWELTRGQQLPATQKPNTLGRFPIFKIR